MPASEAIELVFRDEAGQVVATLVRLFGDIDIRVLAQLRPDEPEVSGLVALMLLVEARRGARTDAAGRMVPLGEQDRNLWDRRALEKGREIVRACLRRNRPGPYQLEAAINAGHCDAGSGPATDWAQILALYDQLLAVMATPVVALNRAVVVAEIDGAVEALSILDSLKPRGYQPYHATRADLLRRLRRGSDATAEYDSASALSTSAAERLFLESRRAALERSTQALAALPTRPLVGGGDRNGTGV